jgi:hypothetical protein
VTAFYANENFLLPVVEELRRLGHDVLTTNDANRSGQAVPAFGKGVRNEWHWNFRNSLVG